MNPDLESQIVKAETRIEAALHSLYVTFIALAGGFLVAATASGAKTPEEVLVYAKSNWLGFVVANLIAPAIRASQASR